MVIAGGLFWSGFTSGFNAATVFSLLTLIVIIIEPLAMVATIVPKFSASIACSRGIQEFLLLKEQGDQRIIGNNGGAAVSSSQEKGGEEEVFPSDCAVALQNVTLIHDDSRPPTVKDASIAVPKGALGLVTGPTGCGKTSTLLSIIGEMTPATGSVYVHDPRIAYCSSTPFIQNTSARKVIIGDQEFDSAWYYKVVKSCELEEDFARLKNGDETTVGSEGCRLSGGQRQRLVSLTVILRIRVSNWAGRHWRSLHMPEHRSRYLTIR